MERALEKGGHGERTRGGGGHGFVYAMALACSALLLSACRRDETSSSSAAPKAQAFEAVAVTTSRRSYRRGEEVSFTITNVGPTPIFFTFGCGTPLVDRLHGAERVPLCLVITESIPDTTVLHPDETRACGWDQTAWQDPGRAGAERFLHYLESAQVPDGRYELRVDYWTDAAQVDALELARTARSEPFTVGSP